MKIAMKIFAVFAAFAVGTSARVLSASPPSPIPVDNECSTVACCKDKGQWGDTPFWKSEQHPDKWCCDKSFLNDLETYLDKNTSSLDKVYETPDSCDVVVDKCGVRFENDKYKIKKCCETKSAMWSNGGMNIADESCSEDPVIPEPVTS